MRYYLKIELINPFYQSIYETVYYTGLPVAILFTLFGTIKKEDRLLSIAIKTIATVVITGVSVYIVMFLMLGGEGKWTTIFTMLENKQNPSIKIVQRGYRCDSTGKGCSDIKVFQTHQFWSHFILVTKIDLTELDSTEWIIVKN